MKLAPRLTLIFLFVILNVQLVTAEEYSFARFAVNGGTELIDLEEAHGQTYNKLPYEKYFNSLNRYYQTANKKPAESSTAFSVKSLLSPKASSTSPRASRSAWAPARYFQPVHQRKSCGQQADNQGYEILDSFKILNKLNALASF